MCHYEKALKASDIVWSVSVSAVIWSSVLISVTWMELLWAVYKFLRINNIDLKCSFVRCPKISQVMMKWRRRASHLGRFTLLHNGRRAAQLCRFTLWHNGRGARQLSRFTLWHNGRRNFCQRWTFWKIQQTQIDSRPSANSWICTLYEDSAHF